MLNAFYEAVLPGTGSYCIFLLASKQHVWASSIDSLLDHTEARADQQGVYFGTASFKEPTTRTQANVLALRALRLDIDAGAKKHEKNPEGTYPTQRDALAAAVAFFRATRIAPTFVVSSGEGLHIYYALDEPLEPAEWLPLASRLGELTAEHGLKADSSVTTDTARVLRPLGSLHPNGKRVSLLGKQGPVWGANVLASAMGVSASPVAAPARQFDMSVNEDVVSVVGPPKSVHKIVEHCPAMAEIAAALGDVPEPHWRAMLGVVKFTVEGVGAAHELSRGHPDYDPAETEKKFDAWATGPTSCAEFAKHTKACGGCAHRGKIKSPVMLGLMTPDQVAELPPELQPPAPAAAAPTGDPWDGQLPPRFSVTRKPCGELTLVYAMEVPKETETGDTVVIVVPVPVTHTIFWLTHWAESAHADDTAQAVVQQWDDKYKTITTYPMEQSLIADRYALLKFLASKAIVLTAHKKAGQAMDDLIRAQLHRIRTNARRPKIADRFGLRIQPNGELICAHGKYVIGPDGTVTEGMLSKPLREAQDRYPITCLPASDNGEWPATVWADYITPAAQQHAAFMRKWYADSAQRKYRLAMMLGIASPLMPFITASYHTGAKLPPTGLSVSLFSRDTARGKTTAVQVAMTAFGDSAALVKGAGKIGATDIARIVRLSQAGTMPNSMEEMGNNKEMSVTELISSVANGSGRDRGTKEGGISSGTTWSLINLITTNRAQRDMVAATQAESAAIQVRLLELNCDGGNEYDNDTRLAFDGDFGAVQQQCTGALGALLHYAICKQGPARMNAFVLACVAQASKKLNAVQDARFQYRALGALIAAHILLAREGVTMFDLDDLIDEFRDAHGASVSYVAENVLPTDGGELMQMMLSDMKPRTLITDTETHRGIDKNKFDIPLNSRVPDTVVARHIVSMGWTYVSGAAMRDWCVERKVSEREMIADCKRTGVLVAPHRAKPAVFSLSIDLFKGTKEESAVHARCYKVNTRQLRAVTGSDWADAPSTANVTPITPTPRPTQAATQPQENEA